MQGLNEPSFFQTKMNPAPAGDKEGISGPFLEKLRCTPSSPPSQGQRQSIGGPWGWWTRGSGLWRSRMDDEGEETETWSY